MTEPRDDADGFVQPTAADVAEDNPRMIAGQLRALQREVRSGFELLTNRLETMMERFATRQEDHGQRITELERDRIRTNERLTALEARKEP